SSVYLASLTGITMLRQNGSAWKKVAGFAADGQTFRSLSEDPDGRLWAATNDAIWRLDFRAERVAAERFGASEGIPPGWKNPRLFRDHMVFTTRKGLLRFSEASKRFEPDPELGAQFADGSRDVYDVFSDPKGNVWVTGEHYHGILLKQRDGYGWLNAPLLSAGIQEVYQAAFDDDGVAWVYGANGVLYRWEQPLYGNPDDNFQVLTRRIGVIGGSRTVYGGAGALGSVRLPFGENALRFEFAAPFSEQPGSVEYQAMLEGSDDGWSAWSHETYKEMTHLSEGSYTFRVRARSPHGAIAESASLSFHVLPPWYRSWWAYCFYLAMLGVVVWGSVNWRTRQLMEKNRRLEQIVEDRTVEIREQRDEIQRQERQGHALLLNILPESVAHELKTNGAVRPVGFDDVTVCFTDFAGFTLSSERLSPDALVEQLNRYFTAFDEIIAAHGLEKLKTIGDSYMFAAGLPAPRASHAVDAVLAALEMVNVVKDLELLTGWKIRVGLHSGPVVAGVVGTRKFAFDIWGNTVNLASRMESSGVPGRVNLSEPTFHALRGLIDCEARGHVHTKDGRDLPMYLVKGAGEEFAPRYAAEFGNYPPASRAAGLAAKA
ncbi:MAG TPA: adenylate/guanylate cyclase domain-containing protein, partial [Bryobacteraceae bacterium]|nr:adenylate/guanylate cyclase domain-containing protein [Bryobacteraceae bacterium]